MNLPPSGSDGSTGSSGSSRDWDDTRFISRYKNMWDKMKNTSDQALRQFFFQRKGAVEYDDNCHRWIVQVEKKPFDILLDSLPWSYNLDECHGWEIQ